MNPVFSIGWYLITHLLELFLVCLYVRFRHFAAGSRVRRAVAAGACVVAAVLLFLPVGGALLPDSGFKFALQGAGNIWIGFSLYSGGLLLILSMIAGIICLIRRKFSRKPFVLILLISLAAGTVINVYGLIHAQQVTLKEYTIEIDKDAGQYEKLKLVLIGDLHLSVNSHLSTIEKMVDMINAQQADAVVIAGDIFTSSYAALSNPEEYARALRGIQTRYGVFAVYGNHDVEETLFGGFPISPISEAFRTKEMEQFFMDCGFTVLYDETAEIADGMVQITGRADGEKAGDGTADRMSPSQVLEAVDQEKAVIVLQHEPVEFKALKECGADLALCGHTHAGQIFPGNLIVPFFNENAYGYKNVGGLDTIVTSGVGYYGPPLRVGTNSEIAVINMVFNS